MLLQTRVSVCAFWRLRADTTVFFGVCNGRQLKIDAPLSPTIFLPIFVFKFASGYAAPPVCSVGVILTVYRGQGFAGWRIVPAISLFFFRFPPHPPLCFYIVMEKLTREKLYTNSSTCLMRDMSRRSNAELVEYTVN